MRHFCRLKSLKGTLSGCRGRHVLSRAGSTASHILDGNMGMQSSTGGQEYQRLQVDAVYMSPPWGGPSYAAKTFEVERDVGGLGCSMHQLLASAFSLLPEGVVLSCMLGIIFLLWRPLF